MKVAKLIALAGHDWHPCRSAAVTGNTSATENDPSDIVTTNERSLKWVQKVVKL